MGPYMRGKVVKPLETTLSWFLDDVLPNLIFVGFTLNSDSASIGCVWQTVALDFTKGIQAMI